MERARQDPIIQTPEHVHEMLERLSAALEIESSKHHDLLVCGGAALNVTGLVTRTTDDVDILALVVDGSDVPARPLPEDLERAIARVARDLSLPSDWLNAGPTDMQRFGLPVGILERAFLTNYGRTLTVRFATRFDQIHLKLFALVDQGPGKHLRDFRSLDPSSEEVVQAARWCRTQDPSEGFRSVLTDALSKLGFDDVVGRVD